MIIYRICTRCYKNLPTNDFYKRPNGSSKLRSKCKKCFNLQSKNWQKNNSEKYREISIKWKKNNPEKAKESSRKSYYKHRDKRMSESRKWQKNNAKRHKSTHLKYINHRRKSDILYKISDTLRSRTRLAIKNNQKSGSAVVDLGCSIGDLKSYLEIRFYSHPITGKKMTWDNWGRGKNCWHIDHIKPLSIFDLTDREQFVQACHYINLQPLWWDENIRKSNKY